MGKNQPGGKIVVAPIASKTYLVRMNNFASNTIFATLVAGGH
jgi:hypothetical protein